MRRDAATERQVQAADPAASTWLSANAGSGKTRVLTDRVARLLLDGVMPQRILCLTYTKAAASEMQNRLFHRLGEWAMLEHSVLRRKLRELGLEQSLDDNTLRSARRLFARAIETPGGLKIQTIHGFCASLLRRFPLEAGVSPQFTEMDDRSTKRLREEIMDDLAAGLAPDAFDGIARWFTGSDLDKLTREIAKHRNSMPKHSAAEAIWRALGLRPGTTDQDVIAVALLGGEDDLIADLLQVLRAGSTNDMKAAKKLEGLDLSVPGIHTIVALEGVFLTGAKSKMPFSAKVGSFPTKGVRDHHPELIPPLNELMARIEAARGIRVSLMLAQKTLALHRFAAAFLPEYAARKLRHGWLDFDDLILKTRDLLTDPGVAEWVLYRLDGGIDHILVDEAQDTSPVQWQVIDLLTRELTAGEGTHAGAARSIFVVGDKKQSIYSFQGADPDGFDRMRAQFHERLKNGPNTLQNLLLEYSFRSSGAILNTVDNTFHENARRGLGTTVLHRAFRADMPGRVDLWPVIEKSENPAAPEWSDPVDTISSEHHMVRLANRIAGEIRRMIDARETLWTEVDGQPRRRPIQAGDFLILVQRRSALFHEIIRACKSEKLPMAGADRLKIGGELAVKDLTALLAFLATPEDSLSLAAALRSPLFGWSQSDIFDLAAGREEKYLWARLRHLRHAYSETLSVLDALLNDADFLRPYDLIERILTRHDGRRNLISRLGGEAEDGIDAMLSQALAYEQMEVPSLTGFLVWLESGEVEIKRQLDRAGDRIRVMTVHGSKGLEAPIVILPDTGRRIIQINDELLAGPGGLPLWKTPTQDSPEIVIAARDALIARQEEERQRLLYVAMTRAEQWLITCAAGDLDKGNSWYEKIEQGATRAGALPFDFGFGRGLRYEIGDWSAGSLAALAEAAAAVSKLPDWTQKRAASAKSPPAPLSPSGLGGAKALAGEGAGLDEEAAKRRGSRLHLLLEHLPGRAPANWAGLAQDLLTARGENIEAAEIRALLAETETLLQAPHLADLFARPALTEVDLTASLPTLGGARLHGAIDRLIVEGDCILAIDYKSNARVPDRAENVPVGLLRQMGAYAAALTAIYPGRRIETAILWTSSAQLMALPSQLVAHALATAATS